MRNWILFNVTEGKRFTWQNLLYRIYWIGQKLPIEESLAQKQCNNHNSDSSFYFVIVIQSSTTLPQLKKLFYLYSCFDSLSNVKRMNQQTQNQILEIPCIPNSKDTVNLKIIFAEQAVTRRCCNKEEKNEWISLFSACNWLELMKLKFCVCW